MTNATDEVIHAAMQSFNSVGDRAAASANLGSGAYECPIGHAEIVERLERSFALASDNDRGLASGIEDIRDRLGRVRDAVVARESDKEPSDNS